MHGCFENAGGNGSATPVNKGLSRRYRYDRHGWNNFFWIGPIGVFLLVIVVLGLESFSSAQETAATTAADRSVNAAEVPTIEQAQSRIAQLQSDRTIVAAQKQSLIAIYESIVSELRLKSETEKQTKELAAKAEAAPTATLEAKRAQETPPARDLISVNALRSYQLSALQSLLQAKQTSLQAATEGRTKTEATITAREASKKELPRSIAEGKSSLKKLSEKLVALPAVEVQDPLLREAELVLLRAQIASLSEQIRKHEQEMRVIEAEAELLPLRKASFTADERYYNARVKEIVEELNKRRETKVEEQRLRVEALASESPSQRATDLVVRAKKWFDLAKQNTALQIEIEQAQSFLDFWVERHRIMTDRSQAHRSQLFRGINSWNGMLLRRHRNELPDEGNLDRELSELLTRMQQTETLIIELEDWKNDKLDPSMSESVALETIREFPSNRLEATPEDTRLQSAERDVVTNFVTDANNYSDNLSKLADVKQATIEQVLKYRAFIDQQILWVRSAEPVGKSDLQKLWPAIQYVFGYERWWQAGKDLLVGLRQKTWQPFAFGLLWITLLFYTTHLRRLVGTLGTQAERTTTVEFLPTAKCILFCLLLAAPLPLLLLYFGYRLQQAGTPQSFTASLGLACLVGARYFYPLEVVRQVCRKNGLAEKHFEWPLITTSIFRRHLRWFIDLGVPSVAVCALLFNLNNAVYENALGRLSFTILMLLCGLFFAIVLRPSSGVLAGYLAQYRGGWIERLRYIWYSIMVTGPLLLCLNSLSGYHYTAVRLSMLCHTSLVTILGLFLIYQIVFRWLMLSRRRIMTDQARQRLEVAQQRESEGTNQSSHIPVRILGPESSSIDQPHAIKPIDLAEIKAQTLRLSFSVLVVIGVVALGYIWAGVLPAVNALNSITLWTVDEETPFTLAHLLVAVPFVIMTYVAAKNLPGLLEIALLQRLPFDNAARYAIASISRYVILLFGIVLTFQFIGVSWGSIQWLVAALGVGLGFGLQEIFANFVSGLILLFEQPIRVGDVITLGDTTGSVSRIRMRATTITNWDRQELVIPNKDLITGRLLNWTLSDTTNRLVLNIGVAYGSDTELACRIIREICEKHANIMTDPPTTAFLDNFGDSSLNIVVRLFLSNLDTRVLTRHELLTEIHRRFAAAGIEIAFPQRDLHIRSIPEALANLLKSKADSTNAN
jgi:potassium-dependent mechanosensitive channel